MNKIFRWNRILHRDIGYLVVGLTIIFAVTGIALNHEHDWNPNHKIVLIEKSITSPLPSVWTKQEMVSFLNKQKIEEKFLNYYFVSPNELRIFVESGTVTIDLEKKEMLIEKAQERPVLKKWIMLHRNRSNIYWTILSDTYAFLLIFLSFGGLFMVRGRNGFCWRGMTFSIIGILLGVLFTLTA